MASKKHNPGCPCCDELPPSSCLAARGHFGRTQGDTISYDPFNTGSQVQLTLSGFPASVFARQVLPSFLTNLDRSFPWREYTWTGLDDLNGTFLVDLPLTGAGCIGALNKAEVYTSNATCQVDNYRYEKKSFFGTDCAGATLITGTSSTIAIQIKVFMYITLWDVEFRAAFWEIEMFPNNWCPLHNNLQHFKFFRTGESDPNGDTAGANTVRVAMDADGIDTGISGNIRWTHDFLGGAPCPPLVIPEPVRDWDPAREHPSCPVDLQSDVGAINGNVAAYQMDLIRA